MAIKHMDTNGIHIFVLQTQDKSQGCVLRQVPCEVYSSWVWRKKIKSQLFAHNRLEATMFKTLPYTK